MRSRTSRMRWPKTIIYSFDIRGNARFATSSNDVENRMMENQDLRRIGVHSCILTFDATNVPLDGTSLECAVQRNKR